MRKIRKDSTWNSLTKQQRETLEIWLFDENLGYKKALERVKAQFGIQASMTSLCRYYRRRAWHRQAGERVLTQMNTVEPNNLNTTADNVRHAALITSAKTALQLPAEKQMDHLLSLTRLLLQNERAELQRSRLELAERCFIYKAAATMSIDSLRSPLAAISEERKGHPEYGCQTAKNLPGIPAHLRIFSAYLRLNQKSFF